MRLTASAESNSVVFIFYSYILSSPPGVHLRATPRHACVILLSLARGCPNPWPSHRQAANEWKIRVDLLRPFQHMSHAAARDEWSESAAKKWGRERVLAAQV
jgi:hypothetical protein